MISETCCAARQCLFVWPKKMGGCRHGIRPMHHLPGGGKARPCGTRIRRSLRRPPDEGCNVRRNFKLLASLDLARRFEPADRDGTRLHPLGDVALQIDVEQAILQVRTLNFDEVGELEAALE